MNSNVRKLEQQQPSPRFVDPNALPETQYVQLMEFIKNPPENSRVVVITPGLAQLILDRLNTRNRKKRPSKIKKMADAMESGKWQLTGATIVFSRARILLDGQNRLSACVRSGFAFKTHVVFGIEDQAFSVIDINAVRNNNDTLKIEGAPYPDVCAQAVRWLMIYDADPLNRGATFSNEELLAYYRQTVDKDALDRAVRRAVKVKRPLPSGSLAAHIYMFDRAHKKATDALARDLIEPRGGALKLIKKLTELRKQNMGRLHETQVNALIVQTWRSYRDGIPVTAKVLNWNINMEYPSIG